MSYFFEITTSKSTKAGSVNKFDMLPIDITYLSFPSIAVKTNINLKSFYNLKKLVTEPFSNLDDCFHKEDLNIEIFN